MASINARCDDLLGNMFQIPRFPHSSLILGRVPFSRTLWFSPRPPRCRPPGYFHRQRRFRRFAHSRRNLPSSPVQMIVRHLAVPLLPPLISNSVNTNTALLLHRRLRLPIQPKPYCDALELPNR